MKFQDCHEEPIHTPSHIQDYGYLIGLDEKDYSIQFYSQNLPQLISWEGEFLGKKLSDFSTFEKINQSIPFREIELNAKDGQKILEKITIGKKNFHLTTYKFNGILFVELEEFEHKKLSRNIIYQGIKEIQSAKTKNEIWQALINNIYNITGYDRVMVYKFMNDGTGKVVAEKKDAHLDSYMNLHYPESDIPQQARSLYLKNLKRIFSNVDATPVPVISRIPEIDMTYSTVRAMSPIHGMYIKNSGSASSFSTSIIIDNQLWGLVTCQNTTAKHVDLYRRMQAEICTNLAANNYYSIQSKKIIQAEIEFMKKTGEMKNRLISQNNLEKALFDNLDFILNISHSDGFAISYDGKVKGTGFSPSKTTIQEISKWLKTNVEKSYYTNSSFYLNHKNEIDGLDENCCGLAATFIGKDKNIILFWFRKEYREHIDWAGKPEKNLEPIQFYDEKINAFSPRTSFLIYRDEIRNKSKSWSKKDISEIRKINDAILETLQFQLQKIYSLNQELQKLNEELDSFSHTVSHDLSTPLTVIKLNAQRLYNQYKENPGDREKLQNVLDEVENMSKMITHILEMSRIKHAEYQMEIVNPGKFIKKICENSKLNYDSPAEITIGETPEILGDSTLIYQVFQNMITNAVKYSSTKSNPKVEINGIDNGRWVTYNIKDNGIGIPKKDNENVFKLFNRNENAKNFEGTGVGLAIVKRIMTRLEGKITFDSKENEGTTFTLNFKKPSYAVAN